jgi:transcriptional regulator with GAF, ATPase, and Fis domain
VFFILGEKIKVRLPPVIIKNMTRRKLLQKLPQNNETVEVLGRKIDFWRDMTAALLNEIKSISFSNQIKLDSGFELEEEVKRFEIKLINQALKQAKGNQKLAAQLLNIKYTTLNAKIKRLAIEVPKTAS